MSEITQDTRLIAVTTPLGKDKLILQSIHGREEMSRLFTYQLGMVSSDHDIKPADLVGKSVTAEIRTDPENVKYVNGIVRRLSAHGVGITGYRGYRIELVPELWLLTQTADCRIFQEKNAKQIIEQIFDDLGFSDYQMNVNREPRTRTYCVQYRMTDLDFVSYLMEEEGLFYYFKHEDGSHKLVIGDEKGAYYDCAHSEAIYSRERLVVQSITDWEHVYEYHSGKVAQTDYNFTTPSTSLMANTNTINTDVTGTDKYEVYDYPGVYGTKGEGDALMKLRMEEREAPYEVVRGQSDLSSFSPGGVFKIKYASDHVLAAEAEEGSTYVHVAVELRAEDQSHFTHQGGGPPASYSNTFTCVPKSVKYRPARITPRPIVQGPHTAVVVGPSGEEIFTDEYGRVKVQFHWDREGEMNDKSSCWIRVSQNWAGKKYGIHWHPRIGQEVVVSFLEGNPDRPLITGRVYNAEQMPPYELPANQTQSGFKSLSTKEGDVASNYNELRIEDKKGQEYFYIHAEKDMTRVVENDDVLTVGWAGALAAGATTFEGDPKDTGNQWITIRNDRTEVIEEGNEDLTIKLGNRTELIETGNDELTISTGNRTELIDTGNEELTVEGNRTITVRSGNHSKTISSGNQETVVSMGNQSTEVSMGNQSTEVSMGDITTKASLGNITLEAMQSITLKCMGSSIKIDPMQITIKAPMVKIQGDAMVDVKSVMTQVAGDAMLILKGGITMIN